LILERRDGIATVTFNRPEQRNAISYRGWLDLRRIASELEQDPEVKVVVFTGAGDEAFSAGADIKDFDRHRSDSERAKVYAEAFDGALDDIEALSKPTVSLIKGYCVGGGCELSMATDIRIAADNSDCFMTTASNKTICNIHGIDKTNVPGTALGYVPCHLLLSRRR